MKVNVICMSTDPYETMHDYVNMDAFDYFEEDSEKIIRNRNKMFDKIDKGDIVGYIDYRMFVKVSDFLSRDEFLGFVKRRVEANGKQPIHSYDIHVLVI